MASYNHNRPRRSRTQMIMKHYVHLESENGEEYNTNGTNEIMPQNNLPKNSNDSFNRNVAVSSPKNHQTLNQERRKKEEIQRRDEGEIQKRNEEEIQERDKGEIQERDEEKLQKRDEEVTQKPQYYLHSNNWRGNGRSFHQKKFYFSKDSIYYSNSNYSKRGISHWSLQNNKTLDENKRDEEAAKEVELPNYSRNNYNDSFNRNIPDVSLRNRETLDQERKDETEDIKSENFNNNNNIRPIGYEKKSLKRDISNSQFRNKRGFLRSQSISPSFLLKDHITLFREERGRGAARQNGRAPSFPRSFNSNFRTNRRSFESEKRNINEVRSQRSLHHDSNHCTKYERSNYNNFYQKDEDRGLARSVSWSQRSCIKKDIKNSVQKKNDEGAASIVPESTSAFHNDEISLSPKEDIENHVHEEIDGGAASIVSELTSAFHNDEISLPPKEDIKNHVHEEIDEGTASIVPELLSLLSDDETSLPPNEDTKHHVRKGKGKGDTSIDPKLLSFLYNDEISLPPYENIKDHLSKENDEGAASIAELQRVFHNDEIPPSRNEDIEQHAQKKSSHEGVANVVAKSQNHQPEDDELSIAPHTLDYLLVSSKDELAHTVKGSVINELTGMQNALGLRELRTIFSKFVKTMQYYCKLNSLILFLTCLIFFFMWHCYNLIVPWRIIL